MKVSYITHDKITKEILDTIQIGDLIKCNDWKKPLKVVGISDNYFIMRTNQFGKCVYSICEKKKCDYTRNDFSKGNFRIGRDNRIFSRFDYLNNENIQEALIELENGELELSHRNSVNLNQISVKHTL